MNIINLHKKICDLILGGDGKPCNCEFKPGYGRFHLYVDSLEFDQLVLLSKLLRTRQINFESESGYYGSSYTYLCVSDFELRTEEEILEFAAEHGIDLEEK